MATYYILLWLIYADIFLYYVLVLHISSRATSRPGESYSDGGASYGGVGFSIRYQVRRMIYGYMDNAHFISLCQFRWVPIFPTNLCDRPRPAHSISYSVITISHVDAIRYADSTVICFRVYKFPTRVGAVIYAMCFLYALYCWGNHRRHHFARGAF